jgi:hypothetical protein
MSSMLLGILAASGSGGAIVMEKIADSYFSSNTLDFINLDSTDYAFYRIMINVQGESYLKGLNNLKMTFNNTSGGSSYGIQRGSSSQNNTNNVYFSTGESAIDLHSLAVNTSPYLEPTFMQIDIINPGAGGFYKQISMVSGSPNNTNDSNAVVQGGYYKDTAAITKITFSSNETVNQVSRVAIYGAKYV